MKGKVLVDILYERKNSLKTITVVNNNNKENEFLYSKLYDNALKVATFLQIKKVKKKSEIIFQVNDLEKFLIWYWGCLLGGFIPVPLSVVTNEQSRKKLFLVLERLNNPYILTSKKNYLDLKTNLSNNFPLSEENVFFENQYNEELIDVKKFNYVEINENDIAFIQYSSGSTGNPKGVVLTHKNLITTTNAMIINAKITENDKTLGWMPLTHDLGLIGHHLLPLVADISQVILPTTYFIRSPIEWLKKIHKTNSSLISSPNFGYNYTIQKLEKIKNLNIDLSCVRLIFNGAEPISYNNCLQFNEVLSKFGLKKSAMFPVYGLAEASLAVAFPPPEEELFAHWVHRKHTNVEDEIIFVDKNNQEAIAFVDEGYPVFDCQVKIVNHSFKLLPEKTVGIIYIKGNNVTSEYYNDLNESKNRITDDGWVNTGDLGFIINGRLVVTGRIKDIVFVNGQNFYAHDIERTLESNLPNNLIGKIVAIGIFNPKSEANELVIFIVFKKSLVEFIPIVRDVIKLIRKNFGVNQINVIPIKSIPKTTSGKVQRFKLESQFINNEFDDLIAEINHLSIVNKFEEIIYPENEIESTILNIWKEVLQESSIGVTTDFHAVGGDSIKAFSVMNLLQQKGFSIPQNKFFECTTIRELSFHVEPLTLVPLDETKFLYEIKSIDLLPSQYFFFNNTNFKENYNGGALFYVSSRANNYYIEKAFHLLVNYHESLRSLFSVSGEPDNFGRFDGDVVQLINNNFEKSAFFEVIDFTDYSMDLLPEKFRQKIMFYHDKIDFEKGPVIIGALFKAIDGDHFFINMHHLLMDLQSLKILASDFFLIYKQFLSENEIKLPQKSSSTEYLVSVINEKIKTKELLSECSYWKKIDDNIEFLPVDNVVNRSDRLFGKRSGTVHRILDVDLFKQLKNIALENNINVSDLIQSAWCLSLQKLFKVKSCFYEVMNNGRDWYNSDIDTVRSIGWLAYRYPVLIELKPSSALVDLAVYIANYMEKVPERGQNYQILREIVFRKNSQDFCPRLNSGKTTLFIYQGEINANENKNQSFTLSPYHINEGIGDNSAFLYSFFADLKVIDNVLHLTLLYLEQEYDEETYLTLVSFFKEILINNISGYLQKN